MNNSISLITTQLETKNDDSEEKGNVITRNTNQNTNDKYERMKKKKTAKTNRETSTARDFNP